MHDDIDILGEFERITNPDPLSGFTDVSPKSPHEAEDPVDYSFSEFPEAPHMGAKTRSPKIHMVTWFSTEKYLCDADGTSDVSDSYDPDVVPDPLSDFVTQLQDGINAINTKITTAGQNTAEFEAIPRTGDWIVSKSNDGIDVHVLVAWAGHDTDGISSEHQQTLASAGASNYAYVKDGVAAGNKYVFVFMTPRWTLMPLYVGNGSTTTSGGTANRDEYNVYTHNRNGVSTFVGCALMLPGSAEVCCKPS